MKKVIFECVGSSVIMALMGLMLLNPFSSFREFEYGFELSIGPVAAIFAVSAALFIILKFVFMRGESSSIFRQSELDYSDEREKTIVAESAKTAYIALMLCQIISAGVIALTKVFSLDFFRGINLDIYSVCVVLLTLNMIIGLMSYCVKYCVQYKK